MAGTPQQLPACDPHPHPLSHPQQVTNTLPGPQPASTEQSPQQPPVQLQHQQIPMPALHLLPNTLHHHRKQPQQQHPVYQVAQQFHARTTQMIIPAATLTATLDAYRLLETRVAIRRLGRGDSREARAACLLRQQHQQSSSRRSHRAVSSSSTSSSRSSSSCSTTKWEDWAAAVGTQPHILEQLNSCIAHYLVNDDTSTHYHKPKDYVGVRVGVHRIGAEETTTHHCPTNINTSTSTRTSRRRTRAQTTTTHSLEDPTHHTASVAEEGSSSSSHNSDHDVNHHTLWTLAIRLALCPAPLYVTRAQQLYQSIHQHVNHSSTLNVHDRRGYRYDLQRYQYAYQGACLYQVVVVTDPQDASSSSARSASARSASAAAAAASSSSSFKLTNFVLDDLFTFLELQQCNKQVQKFILDMKNATPAHPHATAMRMNPKTTKRRHDYRISPPPPPPAAQPAAHTPISRNSHRSTTNARKRPFTGSNHTTTSLSSNTSLSSYSMLLSKSTARTRTRRHQSPPPPPPPLETTNDDDDDAEEDSVRVDGNENENDDAFGNHAMVLDENDLHRSPPPQPPPPNRIPLEVLELLDSIWSTVPVPVPVMDMNRMNNMNHNNNHNHEKSPPRFQSLQKWCHNREAMRDAADCVLQRFGLLTAATNTNPACATAMEEDSATATTTAITTTTTTDHTDAITEASLRSPPSFPAASSPLPAAIAESEVDGHIVVETETTTSPAATDEDPAIAIATADRSDSITEANPPHPPSADSPPFFACCNRSESEVDSDIVVETVTVGTIDS